MIASRKAPQTWAEFLEAAKIQIGALCQCGSPTCGVTVPLVCPSCGGPLSVVIHTNAPTLIIGCTPCGRSGAFLKLERGGPG